MFFFPYGISNGGLGKNKKFGERRCSVDRGQNNVVGLATCIEAVQKRQTPKIPLAVVVEGPIEDALKGVAILEQMAMSSPKTMSHEQIPMSHEQ